MNSIDIDQYVETSWIHPINAHYLLGAQPYRLYGDMGGNLLELMVRRFATNSMELLDQYGGVIGMSYHDATTNGSKSIQSTHILYPNGHIVGYKNQIFSPYLGNKFGILDYNDGIDMDIIYMLLNPIEFNNWYLQNPNHVESINNHKPGYELSRLIARVRIQFLEQLSPNKK